MDCGNVQMEETDEKIVKCQPVVNRSILLALIFYIHKATEVMPNVYFGIQVTMQSYLWCVKEVTQWPMRV